MDKRDVALRVQGVCKSFGKIRAVDDLSLEVHAGEMIGFLGPNGAGKSTTLSMIARFTRPSAGHIRIFGHDVWKDFKAAIRPVGTMVDRPAFYEYLSARKNLELVARLRGDSQPGQIETILTRVGLASRARDKVATYSQGMKQRLGLGMTLLGKPKLLILDEPTNGMDPEGTREIMRFLREQIKHHSLAVFISSHLLSEVEAFCDRVCVINRGRLIASGKVQDILAPRDNVIHVTLKDRSVPTESLLQEASIERIEHLSQHSLEVTLKDRDGTWLNTLLVNRGYPVSSLTPKHMTLREFFLTITGGDHHE